MCLGKSHHLVVRGENQKRKKEKKVMFTSYLLQQPGGLGNSNPRGGGGGSAAGQPENQHQQLFVKDPLSLMQVSAGSDKEGQVRTSPVLNRSQNQPMMTSPMQIIQSQLGLTPQQLQVLMHHHQQQQQLAFQSVSQTCNYKTDIKFICG